MGYFSDGKNFLASEFDSNEELIDAIICSCFIPFYCGFVPPTYRNQYYVDGGLSDNLPRENTTIAVQPWQGEADIRPKDENGFSFSELNFTFANCNIDVTPDNILRFSQMLFPSTVEVCSNFCRQGFHDCYDFLKQNGYIRKRNRLNRRMSFSEEWHEARLRRINRDKLIAIEKTLREFDYMYGDDLKQSALYKEAKMKSDELIQTIEQLNMDSTSEDDDNIVEGDFAEADDDSSAESDQNYLMMKTGDQKALNLPKPVIKSLKSSMKKDREKVPMNNIELTKSLIRLPMEFWGDSMVNWKDHTQKGVLFGLDLIVRQLHRRGVIGSESSKDLSEYIDPTPTISFDIE